LVLFIYNILQLLFLIIFAPALLLLILIKSKYRTHILKRLGFDLTEVLKNQNRAAKKTVWLHALSVGEVTSAVPLISGLRAETDDIFLVVTTSTKSGTKLAKALLANHVDLLFESPLDILPVVRFFIKKIRPDVFILIETDFWPNLLFSLHKQKTASFLVNGRISAKSMHVYHRFHFFFKPLFNTFDELCMQTAADKQSMIALGINENKIHTLGNLKYDTSVEPTSSSKPIVCGLTNSFLLWVCGSTHKGEEEILFSTYLKLKKIYSHLYLIIAPRNIDRGNEVLQLGQSMGLTGSLQSEKNNCAPHFHVLDTIGELAILYYQAHIAFIGGSLVKERGHNPIEAALAKIPVLFGPHMEDFDEICNSLILAGGAFLVQNSNELYNTIEMLLQSDKERDKTGQNGFNNIQQQKGVIHRHVRLIKDHL